MAVSSCPGRRAHPCPAGLTKHTRTEPLYFWGYFVGANAIWILVPSLVIMYCFRHINAAVEASGWVGRCVCTCTVRASEPQAVHTGERQRASRLRTRLVYVMLVRAWNMKAGKAACCCALSRCRMVRLAYVATNMYLTSFRVPRPTGKWPRSSRTKHRRTGAEARRSQRAL